MSITREEKELIRKNFKIASEEFDFFFISPHYMGEDNQYQFFGYLFRDSLEKGVVIDIVSNAEESNKQKAEYCRAHNIFYSSLALEPLLQEYKRSYFREMLRDWRNEI